MAEALPADPGDDRGAGAPVGTVAHRVGYRTPSAFVAAFRRVPGTTPAQVFAGQAA